MWPMLAVGAGLGLLKNIEGQHQASNQRKAQAEIQRWSPWTGLQGQQVQDPSLIGDLSTGAAIGAMGSKMFPGADAAAGAAGAGGMSMPGGSGPLLGASDMMQPKSSWLSLAMNPMNGMGGMGQGMNQPFSLYSK